MKLITRDTDYAIRALCCIARSEKEMVSADELVGKLCMPRPFLRKILQELNKKGLVKSYRGKGGGFKLGTGPDKIFIVDVVKTFQGPFKLNECRFKNEICPKRKTCPLKRKIDIIERYVVSSLGNITIASLL